MRKIPWRREWQPTPVVLPGEFHRQRNLVGYSPWGYKELGMIKRLTLFTFHRIENPYRENAKWFNGYKVSSWGDEGVLKLNVMMVIQPVNTL